MEPLTIEGVLKLFVESDRRFEERLEKQRVEDEKRRAEAEQQTKKQLEQWRIESEKQAEQRRIEDEKRRIEAEQRRMEAEQQAEQRRMEAEQQAEQRRVEADKQWAKDKKENDRMMRNLNKKIGELGDALGLYAEAQVRERIRELFKIRGIDIPAITLHYQMEDGAGGFLYEIDILLYDTDYTIAIEVKHHLKKDDIDDQLERLEKCRYHPPRGTNGKKLLGAVATMIVSAEVEQYAKRQGLFLLKPSGETIKIVNAMNFKPKVWELAE